jgi:hypothetical protein
MDMFCKREKHHCLYANSGCNNNELLALNSNRNVNYIVDHERASSLLFRVVLMRMCEIQYAIENTVVAKTNSLLSFDTTRTSCKTKEVEKKHRYTDSKVIS